MPFQIGIEGQFDIDPTIGAETVRDGIWSGVAGTLLVVLFMSFYYMRAGLIANISLIANCLLLLGALAAFDVTLTLPGIAGIILTLGMAVDANILIYERIREELANNKTIANAIELGFKHAFSAIFDSNMTSLFVAAILMWQGTGAIKGFAITLVIGVLTTLFTAVFLSKLLFDLMQRFPLTAVKTLKMRHIFSNPNYDFLRWRKVAIVFSIVLSLICVGVAFYRGSDIFSVDFTGGRQITFNYDQRVPEDQIAKTLDNLGFESKVSSRPPARSTEARRSSKSSSGRGRVRPTPSARRRNEDAFTKLLNEKFPSAKFSADQMSSIGALIGWEFTKSAIISLVCGMLIISSI
jgi:SecD/SecF fusion protein